MLNAARTFASERLDEIRCGTIELSVPLRHDVILIGAGGDADVGTIRVRREPRAVTVLRVDGRPIQAHVVAAGQEDSRVFEVPLPELRLVRTFDVVGHARWRPEAGSIAAEHIPELKRFADVVGTFAVAKQARAQHSHRGWRDHRRLVVDPVRTSNSSVVSRVGGGLPA